MRLKTTATLKAGDVTFKKNKIFDDSKEEIPEVIMKEYEDGRGTVINLDDPSSTPKSKPKKPETQLLKEKLLKEKSDSKKKSKEKEKKKKTKKVKKKTGKLLKKKK